MKFEALKQQIQNYTGPNAQELRAIIETVSLGGQIQAAYMQHLNEASNWRDFLERIYQDDDARMQIAWTKIALLLHPGIFLERFTPSSSFEALTPNGMLAFSPKNGQADVTVAVNAPSVTVSIYMDGEINETVFDNAEYASCDSSCAGVCIPGPFSIHVLGRNVAVVPWVYAEDGFRVSQFVRRCLA